MNPSEFTEKLSRAHDLFTKRDFKNALSEYTAILDEHPKDHLCLHRCGEIHMLLGEPELAEDYARSANLQSPLDTRTLKLLGSIYLYLEKSDLAIAHLSQASTLTPNDATIFLSLGNAYRSESDFDTAVKFYEKAISLDPNYIEAVNALAKAFLLSGDTQSAIKTSRKAEKIDPYHARTRYHLAKALVKAGDYNAALESYKITLELQPDFAIAQKETGDVLMSLGESDTAIEYFREARTLRPKYASAAAAEAAILSMQGRREAAYELLTPFLYASNPDMACLAAAAGIAHDFNISGAIIEKLKLKLETDKLPLDQRAKAQFTLGYLLDKDKNYRDAVTHLIPANKAYFDVNRHKSELARINAIQNVFSSEFISACPKPEHDTSRPVFIVGMPRSGTSLVEQILSSHADVHGAGELIEINKIAAALPDFLDTPKPYPHCVTSITGKAVSDLSTQYLNHIMSINNDAQVVTDKMPHNFLNLGLIAILFPQAKIIHCSRNPLDTCLSCFVHNLGDAHQYSFDLQALGEYYTAYTGIMAHWKRTIPLPIIDIQYEALVAGQEDTTRKLLDFCSLPWDDRCLSFHKTNRTTATASFNQVNKPIYHSAVDKWKNYESFITPLIDSLGDLAHQSQPHITTQK